jgi:Nif11 domain
VSQQVKQFHQLILQDRSLKERLKTAADFSSFVHMTVEIGQEQGYSFTVTEVESYVNQNMVTLIRQFF